MESKQIINKEAFELGKLVRSTDRVLIQRKLQVTESAVNVVLSGNRRAIRAKSLQIIELARQIAEINKQKAELV